MFGRYSRRIRCLLLNKWQKRHKTTVGVNALHNSIRERCPEWAKWLQDQKL
jgi:hypothetical protein